MIPHRRLLALVTAIFVAVTLSPATATGAPGAADPKSPDSSGSSDAAGDRSAALAALARVESLFAPGASARRSVAGSARPEATLALRDLSLVVDDLPADRQAEARALYRRPTEAGGDGTLAYSVPEAAPKCGPVVCVHYVTSTADAPNSESYVNTALATLNRVHRTYTQAGYKRPKVDGAIGGGTNKVDVYLGDIDALGLYGYCSTDEGQSPSDSYDYSRHAYCVLDDDYANIDSGNSNLEELQVTAAHEYFHAVQYAYDYLEDGWFLEATAAWVEDEMYDNVNDNVQYLRRSPLRYPGRSMDQFANDGWHYGVWIFFRFLTERYTGRQGGLPTLVRDMLRRADGTTTLRNDYFSWQAIDAVLRKRRSSAAAEFTAFSAANRRPGATYSEGRGQRYPAAPVWGRAAITPSRGATGTVSLDHLTSATAALIPRNLSAANWKLRVRLNLAPTARGSRAVLMVTARNGRVRRVPVSLNGNGDATKVVAFSNRSVRRVEVTMVNASGRFRNCFSGTRFSCQGVPRDENLRQSLTAVAFR